MEFIAEFKYEPIFKCGGNCIRTLPITEACPVSGHENCVGGWGLCRTCRFELARKNKADEARRKKMEREALKLSKIVEVIT